MNEVGGNSSDELNYPSKLDIHDYKKPVMPLQLAIRTRAISAF